MLLLILVPMIDRFVVVNGGTSYCSCTRGYQLSSCYCASGSVLIPVRNVQQVITMTKIFIALQKPVGLELRVEFANLVLLENSIQMYNKYINPLAKRVSLELGHLLGVGRVIYVQLDRVK